MERKALVATSNMMPETQALSGCDPWYKFPPELNADLQTQLKLAQITLNLINHHA